jgi:prepilin-type N-terminal cleavage/methylation domain-containing protein
MNAHLSDRTMSPNTLFHHPTTGSDGTHLQAGFSLVELLVVLAILVSIAGIGVMLFGNVDEAQRIELARIELAELASAVRQFHTDTGFWPGYADLDGDSDADEHATAFDWFILTDASLYGGNWDAVSQRGWRGPYLSRLPENKVTVQAASEIDLNGFDNDDSATPVDIDVDGALADPFGQGYALLALAGRAVIVSAGPDGRFTGLGALCDTDTMTIAQCEADLYTDLCSAVGTTDDLVVCP